MKPRRTRSAKNSRASISPCPKGRSSACVRSAPPQRTKAGIKSWAPTLGRTPSSSIAIRPSPIPKPARRSTSGRRLSLLRLLPSNSTAASRLSTSALRRIEDRGGSGVFAVRRRECSWGSANGADRPHNSPNSTPSGICSHSAAFPSRLALLAGNGEQEKQHEAKVGDNGGATRGHRRRHRSTERSRSGGGSGDWVSEMPSRSYRRASSAWKPA